MPLILKESFFSIVNDLPLLGTGLLDRYASLQAQAPPPRAALKAAVWKFPFRGVPPFRVVSYNFRAKGKKSAAGL
jgi:hypothetical protein